MLSHEIQLHWPYSNEHWIEIIQDEPSAGEITNESHCYQADSAAF